MIVAAGIGKWAAAKMTQGMGNELNVLPAAGAKIFPHRGRGSGRRRRGNAADRANPPTNRNDQPEKFLKAFP